MRSPRIDLRSLCGVIAVVLAFLAVALPAVAGDSNQLTVKRLEGRDGKPI